MKSPVNLILFIICLSLNINGQTLEEREKSIAQRNHIKSKVQIDYKFTNGKPSDVGKKADSTIYSKKGDILSKYTLGKNGIVSNWEKYTYDANGNRTLFEREGTNSKFKKLSKYNHNNQVLLESGFNGNENFRNTYTYTGNGKINEITYTINNTIREKLKYEHTGNTATVKIYSSGNSLKSILKLIYDKNGNTIEETVLGIDGREIEKKKFRYNDALKIIEEEKTRGGKFFYRITNEYDNKGRLSKVYDETLVKKKYLKKSYEYDEKNNLIKYQWRRTPDQAFNEKNYTYNLNGVCLSERTVYPFTKFEMLSIFVYEFF